MTLDKYMEQTHCIRCGIHRKENAWSATLCLDCYNKQVGYVPPEPKCVKCGKVCYDTAAGYCKDCWVPPSKRK